MLCTSIFLHFMSLFVKFIYVGAMKITVASCWCWKHSSLQAAGQCSVTFQDVIGSAMSIFSIQDHLIGHLKNELYHNCYPKKN